MLIWVVIHCRRVVESLYKDRIEDYLFVNFIVKFTAGSIVVIISWCCLMVSCKSSISFGSFQMLTAFTYSLLLVFFSLSKLKVYLLVSITRVSNVVYGMYLILFRRKRSIHCKTVCPEYLEASVVVCSFIFFFGVSLLKEDFEAESVV